MKTYQKDAVKRLFRAVSMLQNEEECAAFFEDMDEALILTSVDLSGRGMLVYDLKIPSEKVGSFDTELVEEFFRTFAVNGGITLHMRGLAGSNSHHIIEGAFKSAARSLRQAVSADSGDPDGIPSTKGVL